MASYDIDVVAWSLEQAHLLRAGRYELLDIEHVADEIESVAKREQQALADVVVQLLSCLLIWQHQPAQQGASLKSRIQALRLEARYILDDSPSLASKLDDSRWLEVIESKAIAQAITETGCDAFPDDCQLNIDEALAETWYPRA